MNDPSLRSIRTMRRGQGSGARRFRHSGWHGSMPPASPDANPPGTPSYVIRPFQRAVGPADVGPRPHSVGEPFDQSRASGVCEGGE
jgi:hypothetical protein